MKIFKEVDDCIDLMNDYGGFTGIDWYKRGQITEKSMITVRL